VLLRFEQVTKRYGAAGAPASLLVLDGVELALARGESVAIVGPSGSGKSTLLNLAGALDAPTSGAVRLDGEALAALPEAAAARVRNRRIGFVFQLHHLLPQCTLLENVLLPTLAGFGAPPGDAVERARLLLERVGLGARLQAFPATLSGGERQRAAVARALVQEPELLLADEPTGSLDGESAAAVAGLLREVQEERGVALLVVTHAAGLARRMGRVLALRGGRLVEGEAGEA
jgi:predicted ABC-type transport system involved in lysophospholipase L1 biosynthesis ATPase subunit